MSRINLSAAASAELIESSAVPLPQQINLAKRLKIDWTEITDVAKGETVLQRERVKQVVSTALALTGRQQLNDDDLKKLAKRRVYFETIMGWTIAADPEKCRQLAQDVRDIQSELWDLSQRPFDESTADRAWDLDGEFHKAFCLASGFNRLTDVVDTVIKEFRSWGLPRSAADIAATWREHERIVNALQEETPDKEEILKAIQGHISDALGRLEHVFRSKDKEVGLLDYRPDEWTQRALSWLDSRNSDIILKAEREFDRRLPDLLKTHYGQWVAFKGEQILDFDRFGDDLYDRCARSKHRVEEILVRRIVPEPVEERIE